MVVKPFNKNENRQENVEQIENDIIADELSKGILI
jgi:hypothetical protein